MQENEIQNMAAAKLTIDASSRTDNSALNQCEQIPEKIAELVEKLPGTDAHIKRVLKVNDFKIICLSATELKNKFKNYLSDNMGEAYFFGKDRSIYLQDKVLSLNIINHEFMHADSFFRHKKPPCKSTLDPAFPLFIPDNNPQKLNEYESALDKGDKRIMEFNKLRKRKREGLKLSASQQKKLDDYLKASSDCIDDRPKNFNAPLQEYDRLIGEGWCPDEKNVDFEISNYGIDFIIKDVIKTNTNTILVLSPATPADAVLLIPLQIKNINETYRILAEKSGLHSEIQKKSYMLAERDALTFEVLSKNAISVFYPEANTLRQKDIEACSIVKQQTPEKKMKTELKKRVYDTQELFLSSTEKILSQTLSAQQLQQPQALSSMNLIPQKPPIGSNAHSNTHSDVAVSSAVTSLGIVTLGFYPVMAGVAASGLCLLGLWGISKMVESYRRPHKNIEELNEVIVADEENHGNSTDYIAAHTGLRGRNL